MSLEQTRIFTEWSADGGNSIIIRIEGEPLPLPEWQNLRDTVGSPLLRPGAYGVIHGPRTLELIFREKPPREFVEWAFNTISDRMDLLGKPENRARWEFGRIYDGAEANERFARGSIETEEPAPDAEDAVSMTPMTRRCLKTMAQIIEAKNALVEEVGTGRLSVQDGYAALIAAVEAIESEFEEG